MEARKYFRIPTDHLIVIGFFLFVFLPVIIWLHLDTNLPHWDMGRHLYTTLLYRDLWHGLLSGERNIFGLVGFYAYYPPLVYNVGLIFYLLFGLSQDAVVYSNAIWLLILFFSLFSLSKRRWNRRTGFLALLITSASPLFIGQLREFQVDLPLAAMVALALYLLELTESFRHGKFCLLLGLTIGLGLMTKWTFAIIIVPAVMVYLILALASGTKESRVKLILNLLLVVVAAALVCVYWYGLNRAQIKIDFLNNGFGSALREGDPVGFNLPAWSYYLHSLAENYLLLPFELIVLAGLTFSFWSKDSRSKNLPFVALIIVYYATLSYLPNKDARYILPLLPLLALVGASAVNISSSKPYQLIFTGFLILIFIANTFSVSFGRYLSSSPRLIQLGRSNFGILLTDHGYTSASPRSELCPMEAVVATVPPGSSARLIGSNPVEFNNWALAYYLKKSGRIWAGESVDYIGSDYLIFKSDWPGAQAMKAQPVKQFDCQDDSKIIIERNNYEIRS